jgi:hypothetical protein
MQPVGSHNIETFIRLEMQTSFTSGERQVRAFGPPRVLTGPAYLTYTAPPGE